MPPPVLLSKTIGLTPGYHRSLTYWRQTPWPSPASPATPPEPSRDPPIPDPQGGAPCQHALELGEPPGGSVGSVEAACDPPIPLGRPGEVDPSREERGASGAEECCKPALRLQNADVERALMQAMMANARCQLGKSSRGWMQCRIQTKP